MNKFILIMLLIGSIGFSATAQTQKTTITSLQLTKEQKLVAIKNTLDSTNLVQSDKTNCLEMVNWWFGKKDLIMADTTITEVERKRQLDITGATIRIRISKMISEYYLGKISQYLN